MALGRRCELGCASWPDQVLYARCPRCGEPTTRFKGLEPLDADEALSELRHAEFEKFYAEYCSARNQPIEGPLVEADVVCSDTLSSSASA